MEDTEIGRAGVMGRGNRVIELYTNAHICQYTHTPMHTCTNALIHQCTHAPMHSYTNAHMHQCTHTPMHTYTNTLIHQCTHAPIHSYTNAHIHQYTHTPMRTCTHLQRLLCHSEQHQVAALLLLLPLLPIPALLGQAEEEIF